MDGQLIAFYREDTGEKLLIPSELAQALQNKTVARQQAEERAEQAELEVERLKERLRSLGLDPIQEPAKGRGGTAPQYHLSRLSKKVTY